MCRILLNCRLWGYGLTGSTDSHGRSDLRSGCLRAAVLDDSEFLRKNNALDITFIKVIPKSLIYVVLFDESRFQVLSSQKGVKHSECCLSSNAVKRKGSALGHLQTE